MFQPFSVSETPSATPRSPASCPGSWWPTRRTSSACARSIRRWRRARAPARSRRERGRLPGRALRQDRAEAVALLRDTNYAGFQHYFGGFGFWEAFRTPEDAAKYPLDPYTPLPPAEWTVDRMRRVKYALAGTLDQVKAEIEALRRSAAGATSSGSAGSSIRVSCPGKRRSARSSSSPSTSSRRSGKELRGRCTPTSRRGFFSACPTARSPTAKRCIWSSWKAPEEGMAPRPSVKGGRTCREARRHDRTLLCPRARPDECRREYPPGSCPTQ